MLIFKLERIELFELVTKGTIVLSSRQKYSMKLFSSYEVQAYFNKYGIDLTIKEIRKIPKGRVLKKGRYSAKRISLKNWIV